VSAVTGARQRTVLPKKNEIFRQFTNLRKQAVHQKCVNIISAVDPNAPFIKTNGHSDKR